MVFELACVSYSDTHRVKKKEEKKLLPLDFALKFDGVLVVFLWH